MKELGGKILLFAVFLFLVIMGFLGNKMFFQHHPQNDAPKNVNIKDKPQENYHKYGRLVNMRLMWEDNQKFWDLCRKHKVSIRMAAFKTTIPDPLPGEEDNVALAADMLAGTVVNPGEIFSLNAAIGPYTAERGYKEGPAYRGTQVIKTIGGGVCKIATTLYNLVILADLKVIERHAHGMLVPYVPPGQDATISSDNTDFKFENTTGHPVLIFADTRKNTLYMALYGRSKPPKVVWHHRISNRQKNYTVYRRNPALKPGTQKVAVPGAEGMTVESWLTIENANGKTITRKLGVDHYRPMPRVIERGVPNG